MKQQQKKVLAKGMEGVQSHCHRGRDISTGSEKMKKSCGGEKKKHAAEAQGVFRLLHGVFG